MAGAGGLDPFSPLSELRHPIIRKAVESFNDDATRDNHAGRIRSSTHHVLLEIRSGQWRGGVWVDPDGGVCWLVAAGLAKGHHNDHDDFYQRVKRADELGETDRWLPTDDDRRQLRREIAARLLPDWEIGIQHRVLDAMRLVHDGGTTAFALPHPIDSAKQFGHCALTVVRVSEGDFEHEEIVVEVNLANEFRASDLGWKATLRVLIAVSPPETGWDRVGDVYSTIGDIGSLVRRLDELQAINDSGQVAQSSPNDKAHYTHRQNLAISTVEGKGVRSMCGVYFVPYQDHVSMPMCKVCEERYLALPT